MFEIVVTRLKDGKSVAAQASHRQMLRDYLEASAHRNGFTVRRDHELSFALGCSVGEVLKGDAVVVASWEIGEVK